jgi:hypothetical protein
MRGGRSIPDALVDPPRGPDLRLNKAGKPKRLIPFKIGVPTGIRTPVLTVKGWCPRPLDDGDKSTKTINYSVKSGGARRDRTADLLHAMQALSQLSYGPTWRRGTLPDRHQFVKKMKELRAPNDQSSGQSGLGFKFTQNCQGGINWGRHGAAANCQPNGLRQFAE